MLAPTPLLIRQTPTVVREGSNMAETYIPDVLLEMGGLEELSRTLGTAVAPALPLPRVVHALEPEHGD